MNIRDTIRAAVDSRDIVAITNIVDNLRDELMRECDRLADFSN